MRNLSQGKQAPVSSFQQGSLPDGMGSLAQVLSQQIAMNRLPPPEPGIFTGNPLEYQAWKQSFDLLVNQSPIVPVEKLHYLRYVSGEANQCIEGYLLESCDASHHDAKDRLEQRFGHPYIISDAHRKKLKEWPKIGNNGSGLLALSDYLKQLESAQKSNSYLSILDDSMQNQIILTKTTRLVASALVKNRSRP